MSHVSKVVHALLAIGASGGLFGCGGGAGSHAGPATSAPTPAVSAPGAGSSPAGLGAPVCQTVSLADANAAWGTSYADVSSTSSNLCTYKTAGSPDFASIDVSRYSKSLGTFESLKQSAGDLGPLTPVSGVGDEADVVVADGGHEVEFLARKGARQVEIVVSGDSISASNVSAATPAMASKVLDS
ncbi:MAG: hypothetical protein ACYDH6_01290 [Acidimicrobiales bacterium]